MPMSHGVNSDELLGEELCPLTFVPILSTRRTPSNSSLTPSRYGDSTPQMVHSEQGGNNAKDHGGSGSTRHSDVGGGGGDRRSVWRSRSVVSGDLRQSLRVAHGNR